jgi:hypothetical protein
MSMFIIIIIIIIIIRYFFLTYLGCIVIGLRSALCVQQVPMPYSLYCYTAYWIPYYPRHDVRYRQRCPDVY